ncbi:hypothetical protein ACQYAD_17325 [Neobacillus sp. SM06]|uniref:hypothetical protein n=1 Tax=Neobacillus sp. SM06 TaxID=3422492 RepID=UPI003D2DAC29
MSLLAARELGQLPDRGADRDGLRIAAARSLYPWGFPFYPRNLGVYPRSFSVYPRIISLYPRISSFYPYLSLLCHFWRLANWVSSRIGAPIEADCGSVGLRIAAARGLYPWGFPFYPRNLDVYPRSFSVYPRIISFYPRVSSFYPYLSLLCHFWRLPNWVSSRSGAARGSEWGGLRIGRDGAARELGQLPDRIEARDLDLIANSIGSFPFIRICHCFIHSCLPIRSPVSFYPLQYRL